MTIGINLLQYKGLQGIEVFATNLLEELISLGKNNDFVLFVTEKSKVIFNFDSFENVRYVTINPRSYTKLNLILLQQFKLPRAAKKEDIDLLFCPSLAIPLLYRKKIVTVHDCAWRRFSKEAGFISRLYLGAAMFSAKFFSLRIVTVSNFSRNEVEKLYKVNPEHITVISEGISKLPNVSSEFIGHTLDKFNLQNRNFFYFVGNFHHRKNLICSLRAFGLFLNKHSDYLFVISGKKGGYEFENIRKEVQSNGIQDNVIFTDFVTDEEKVALYISSRGLIFPSLYEGFGLPVLEAQSLNVPVLTSNGSSLNETAGEGAVFIDPLSYENIAEGMEELLIRRDSLISIGRENAGRYSWKESARTLLDAIKRIM